MKFAQFEEWMLWYILWKFQIREQASFLNVLYHSALETKVEQIFSFCGRLSTIIELYIANI